MNPRKSESQNLETARAQQAGTATEPKKKQRSQGVLAGQLFEQLRKLNDAEEAEIAAAPEKIREKYAARRAGLFEGVDPAVVEMVERLRG